MLSRISSWPRQKRLRAGLWCSPLLFVTSYAAFVVLWLWLRPLFAFHFRPNPKYENIIVGATLLSGCAFWLACGALAGLGTAFLWRDLELDTETRRRLTLQSAVITWALTFPLCCNWILLAWPYLLVFRFAVDRGIEFWNSNRPRQWLGDFSDMESETPLE